MILKDHPPPFHEIKKKKSLDKPEPQGSSLLRAAQLWHPAFWMSQWVVDTHASGYVQNFWVGMSQDTADQLNFHLLPSKTDHLKKPTVETTKKALQGINFLNSQVFR